jgi:hypothetical protein
MAKQTPKATNPRIVSTNSPKVFGTSSENDEQRQSEREDGIAERLQPRDLAPAQAKAVGISFAFTTHSRFPQHAPVLGAAGMSDKAISATPFLRFDVFFSSLRI